MRRVCLAALMVAALSAQCAWASAPPQQDFSAQSHRPRHVPATIPVDEAMLAQYPDLASVPVEPPLSTDTSSWKFDPVFLSGNLTGARAATMQAARRGAVRKYEPAPIEAGSGYIRVSRRAGQAPKFVTPDGNGFYPGGTSWFNIMQLDAWTEEAIVQLLDAHYQSGVRVLRCFGHIDGRGSKATVPVKYPIQLKPGVFSEVALQRYDFVMDALAKSGIRIIISLTNFWPAFGGMRWYVANMIGWGKPQDLFYTDRRVVAAYQKWVHKLTTRRNTVNGRLYSEDPTIFAWELCNECHTTYKYEAKRNIVPGSLLYAWEVKQAAFLKRSLRVKQMVSTGNEGYRAKGRYDPDAPVAYPFNNWMNDGSKGEDFVRNLGIPYVDFATIHCYPADWGIPAKRYTWVNDNWIGDRAALAAAAGKPLILEEYGAQPGYLSSREKLFSSELGAARQYGLSGTLVWEAWPDISFAAAFTNTNFTNYDFTYSQDGGRSTLRMLDYQVTRTLCSNVCKEPRAVPAIPKKAVKPAVPTKPSQAARTAHKNSYLRAASKYKAKAEAYTAALNSYKRNPSRAKKNAYAAAWSAYKSSQGAYTKNLAAYKAAEAQYAAAVASYRQAVRQYRVKAMTYKRALVSYTTAAAAYQKARNALAAFTKCFAKCMADPPA